LRTLRIENHDSLNIQYFKKYNYLTRAMDKRYRTVVIPNSEAKPSVFGIQHYSVLQSKTFKFIIKKEAFG